jgi:NTE family protein
MNALVISGGGSKGAFAGGIVEFLLKECKEHYDILVGTSTGSLMIPLIALGKIDSLKEIYTSVTNKDIFSIYPFTIKNSNGVTKTGVNYFGILYQYLKGQKTFGDSSPLRLLIQRMFTYEDFMTLKKGKLEIIITVSNLSLEKVEYKRLKECTYKDFCDWMWISANMTPFMSLVNKNGYEYADGGIGNLVPIRKAIKKGATQIDVIVLNPLNVSKRKRPIGNAYSLILNMLSFMHNQLSLNDITIGQLEESLHKNVDIHFYYTPKVLTDNALVFEPSQMKFWWKSGYEQAKNFDPKYCRLIKHSSKIK